MSLMDAAGAVQRLANSMMYDLLHKETIEQGLDPSEYAMFSYGGTAGMHMTSIGEELGVDRVIVPNAASVYGAFGLVNADVIYSDATSRAMSLPADPAVVNEVFSSLEDRVRGRLNRAGELAAREFSLQRTIDVRYRRQVHTITTAVPVEGPLTAHDLDEIGHRFDELYAERYGAEAGNREAGLELVAFSVSAVVPMDRPRLQASAIEGASPEAAHVETREVYFAPVADVLTADCYDFESLRPGNRLQGPAIIWSPTTTIVVNPGQTAECDQYRNVVVTWPGKTGQQHTNRGAGSGAQ
jgi:N-methylhydantoinase A